MSEIPSTEGVIYRAPCGEYVIDKREGPKPVRMGPLLLAWDGNERCKDGSLNEPRALPERCKSCKRKRTRRLSLFFEETKEFYTMSATQCSAFRRDDGKAGGQP